MRRESAYVRGSFRIKGHIRLIHMLVSFLRLLKEREFRIFVKRIMRMLSQYSGKTRADRKKERQVFIMADNSFHTTVESLFKGMDSFITTKTVVGDAIHIGDTIILPMVDVSFGVAAGAFSQDKKNNGAGGMGGKIMPSAVLVIQNGTTKLVNIKNQDGITKVLDMVPDFVNRFTARNGSTAETGHSEESTAEKEDENAMKAAGKEMADMLKDAVNKEE